MWSGPDRSLRRRVRRQLRELGVEPPLRIEDLCRRVGDRRGRPVVLWARPLPHDLSGLTLIARHRDVIVCQADTTPAHRDFIVAHELAHLMLGHRPEPVDGTGDGVVASTAWRELMPDIPESRLCGALPRTCSEARDERAAETTARILRGWASSLDHVHPPGFEPVRAQPAGPGLGAVLVMLDRCWPGLVGRVRWARRVVALWRKHRRLEPLRRVLSPTLGRGPRHSLRARRRRSSVERWVECRDGLVIASAFVPPDEGLARSPAEQVAQLHAALRACAAGETGGPTRQLWAVPAGEGIDADLDALCGLAAAVRAAGGSPLRRRRAATAGTWPPVAASLGPSPYAATGCDASGS